MTEALRDHLITLNGDVLRALARKLEVLRPGMTRKDQFSQAIAQVIELRPSEYLDRLTEVEKLLLGQSVHLGRLRTPREFTAWYGKPYPKLTAYYSYSERDTMSPLVAVVSFPVGEPQRLVSGIVERFKPLLPVPTPPPIRTSSAPAEAYEGRPMRVFESERIAPVELLRVLRLVHASKLKVTDSGLRPTEASVRAIAGVLAVPDFDLEAPASERRYHKDETGPVRAHAWGVLIQQCGLARSKAGTLVLTDAGQELASGFSDEKYKKAVAAYLEDARFDELNRVNHIRGQGGKAKRWMTDPAVRKSGLAEALAEWPVHGWLEFEEARRLVNAAGVDYRVFEGDYGVLHICDAQYGLIYDNAGLDTQFLRAFLMESLATLGLLDIAYVYPHHLWPELGDNWGRDSHAFCGRYDGLRFVRLNPLGAFCLGGADSYSGTVVARAKIFHVLPNLDLTFTGESRPDPADLAFLEHLAVPAGESVWRLDPERILVHIEGGGSFGELLRFLEQNAAEGLPDNVRTWFGELERKARACQSARNAVLLEWEDAAQALLISTTAGLKQLCHHAGENRVVVPARHVAAFTRLARKLGHVLPQPQ